MSPDPPSWSTGYRFSKRMLDIVVGVVLLAATAPLIFAGALLVLIEDGWPPFYNARRVGRRGRVFSLIKLRTMRRDADRGSSLTALDDPRITRVGRWLRRKKIDELPQLINVLKGEMSLVGPRPESPDLVHLFPKEWRACLQVRPGVTGPAQLAFKDEERLLGADPPSAYMRDIVPRKAALDLYYLQTASLREDLVNIYFTCVAVWSRLLRGRKG